MLVYAKLYICNMFYAQKFMRNTILILTLLTFLSSCNQENGKIEFTAYLILENCSVQVELPPNGATISIDTIAKNIRITGVTDNNDLFNLDTDYLPYYNLKTQSADYAIVNIEKKNEALLFNVEASGQSFRCGFLDNSLSILVPNRLLLYVGGEEAKKQNKLLNDSKRNAFDSLTTN